LEHLCFRYRFPMFRRNVLDLYLLPYNFQPSFNCSREWQILMQRRWPRISISLRKEQLLPKLLGVKQSSVLTLAELSASKSIWKQYRFESQHSKAQELSLFLVCWRQGYPLDLWFSNRSKSNKLMDQFNRGSSMDRLSNSLFLQLSSTSFQWNTFLTDR